MSDCFSKSEYFQKPRITVIGSSQWQVSVISICNIIDFIVYFSSYFLQSTLNCSCFIFIAFIHSPSHSFYLPQSISFIFTLFGCIHITWPFNLIVIFTFQPIPSLEIDDLRLSLDKFLILDRYLLLEAELRRFCYSLSLCIKQEIQQYFPSYLRKGGIDSWRLFNLGGRGVTITRKKKNFSGKNNQRKRNSESHLSKIVNDMSLSIW